MWANGKGDGVPRIGVQPVLMARGVLIRGQGYQLTGSGVLAAARLIILSQTGEARLGVGAIHSPSDTTRQAKRKSGLVNSDLGEL